MWDSTVSGTSGRGEWARRHKERHRLWDLPRHAGPDPRVRTSPRRQSSFGRGWEPGRVPTVSVGPVSSSVFGPRSRPVPGESVDGHRPPQGSPTLPRSPLCHRLLSHEGFRMSPSASGSHRSVVPDDMSGTVGIVEARQGACEEDSVSRPVSETQVVVPRLRPQGLPS